MAKKKHLNSINYQRRAGVLLHPTSLPGEFEYGDIGHEAYRFIEFLHAHGFKVWQMLPLGATHEDKSPYQCLSAHAGNPLIISLDWLMDRGWLKQGMLNSIEGTDASRLKLLTQAGDCFYKNITSEWRKKLTAFKTQHQCWLEDFALFLACKESFDNKPWYEWPAELRHRDEEAIKAQTQKLTGRIDQIIFEQFVFFTQWHEVRDYASKHQIEIFGDIPIFVARDSADVWAQRDNFLMDADGEMAFVSGVPPDAFSDTGQRWGNPLYDWEYMSTNDYQWWKERFQTQLELFDMVRIDHFRGLQACWQIPGDDDVAINGSWVEVPGKDMLNVMFKTFDHLPLVAEDLGVITDEVIALKNHFNLPGMKVLQFAFDGNNENPHLPHHQHPGDVVYTGTHDNDTTLGWAMTVENYNQKFLQSYLDIKKLSADKLLYKMIRTAMSSVSFLSVVPMQDLLMQGSESRMNRPGTTENNWKWRFQWDQLDPDFMKKVIKLMSLYQR